MWNIDIKNILSNVISGWLFLWIAAVVLWIKFDWMIALAYLLIVYGVMRLFGSFTLLILKEMQRKNDKFEIDE